MDSTHTFIQIHPKDNTAVALTSLKKDSVLNLDGRMYTLLEDIPQGHKFAPVSYTHLTLPTICSV